MKTSRVTMRKMLSCSLIFASMGIVATAEAQQFSYNPPGQLASGSGTGRVDDTVYVPGMRYPIEVAPSFPNSQVWGRGGLNGGGGGQCDAQNYSYPWWDNYCETRQWEVPLCPGGTGHQGQDIRPSTCEKNVHWAVAAESGTITSIGTYTVYLVTPDGTQHRYLHMEPSSLQVSVNDSVSKGDRLGRVSNAFGDTATTIHLHYDIYQTISGVGPGYVPTYMSLVRSYEELIGMPAEPCGIISPDGGIVDDRDKCFALLGNVQFWRDVDGSGYNDKLYWTYAFTSANPGAWAQWNFELAESGKYRVEAYLTPDEATSKKARYVLRHGTSMQELIVDLSTQNDGWRDLGEFEFNEGGSQSLSLYDNTGESSDLNLKLPADAVRLTRTDGVVTPPDMGSGTPDMGVAMQDMSAPLPDMAAPVRDMSGTPTRDMNTPTSTPDMSAGSGGSDTSSTSSCGEGCAVLPSGQGRLPVEGILLGLIGLGWRRRRRRPQG